MISVIASSGAKTISPKLLADVDFSFTGSTIQRVVRQGTFSDTAIQDRVIRTSLLTDYVTDALVAFSSSLPNAQDYTFLNLTPTIGSIDNLGKVTFLSGGFFSVLARTRWLTRRLNLNFFQTNNGSVSTFLNFVSGTLGANASAAIDSRISTKHDPATNLALFSTRDDANANYVRNTACWTADLDLTCCSPWNSNAGNQMAGTLISPRHIVFAAHFQIGAWSTIRFVTADNQVINRTMTASLTHPDFTIGKLFPDITIGVLDSDVPSSIGFARVLPANYSSYLPSLKNVPAVKMNQFKEAALGELTDEGPQNGLNYAQRFQLVQSNNTTRQPLYKDIITYDSGSPGLIFVNNLPVLIGTWTFGGTGSGTALTPFISWINSAMTTLGGGYQLTTVDLSGFTSF